MIGKPIPDRRRAKKEKRTKKERKLRKGKFVETAAAEEIGQGGLRQHFLDDFLPLLGKPCWVSHSYHKLGDGYIHFKSTGDDNHLIQ